MRWEERLLDLFEDLEQQAEGLHLLERDAEVAERSRAEYAGVDLASRLHASVGARVTMTVAGVGTLEGDLARVGADWCLLLAGEAQEWVVRLAAVRSVRGLSPLAVGEAARSVLTRLGFGSALRGLAETRAPALVCLLDGALVRGLLGRVGADFVEVHGAGDGDLARGRTGAVRRRAGAAPVELVPFAHVAAVRAT